MSKIRVESFTLSLDGFGAGTDQDIHHPLGIGGHQLHAWAMTTRTFQEKVFGKSGGATEGIDETFAARGFHHIGAWVMGRNMFGPIRGAWPDDHWRGWWGENPVYHAPVFVLTHYPRAPLVMEGGTIFHFVTEGIESAIAQARLAASGRDVRIGGGVSVIQQALQKRLIDTMHLAISPVLLGAGERLFEGIHLPALGYECTQYAPSAHATHLLFTRRS